MIFGIVRMVGLRLMGGIFGAWIDPLARYTLAAFVAMVVAVGVARLWPHGDNGAVTQAVTQAVAQRDAIQAEHDKQEAADDGFTAGYLTRLEHWRTEASAAEARAGNVAADNVVIGADDPWLRAKRAGSR